MENSCVLPDEKAKESEGETEGQRRRKSVSCFFLNEIDPSKTSSEGLSFWL